MAARSEYISRREKWLIMRKTQKLKDFYAKTLVAKLMKELGCANVMEVPRITKITLNRGVGEAVNNKKMIENAVADMTKIAGQKPVITKARKSIAGFKVRDGWPVGCKVTLRRDRMYEFLERYFILPFRVF